MNGREMIRQMTNDEQTSKHKLGNRKTDGRKCRQTLAVQIAKSSLTTVTATKNLARS